MFLHPAFKSLYYLPIWIHSVIHYLFIQQKSTRLLSYVCWACAGLCVHDREGYLLIGTQKMLAVLSTMPSTQRKRHMYFWMNEGIPSLVCRLAWIQISWYSRSMERILWKHQDYKYMFLFLPGSYLIVLL